MQPLLEAATPAFFMSGCEVVWIIIARSTSSKWPRRSSSGFSPRGPTPPRPPRRSGPPPPPASPPPLLPAPPPAAVLLGGHREEAHPAGQVLEGSRLEQAHRGPEQSRHL